MHDTADRAPASGYMGSGNRLVAAANGVDFAYRDCGTGERPLVLLQHFRGNLDNWDPSLVDALAVGRQVVTFDNAGVGGSTGTTPSTVRQTGRRGKERSGRRWMRSGASGEGWRNSVDGRGHGRPPVAGGAGVTDDGPDERDRCPVRILGAADFLPVEDDSPRVGSHRACGDSSRASE